MPSGVIDSDILIDIEKRIESSLRFVQALLDDNYDLLISVISLTEVYSGTTPGSDPMLDAALQSMILVPVSETIARRGAEYRRTMRSLGRALHTPDAIIAATTRELGAALVTRNVRDFGALDIEVLSPASMQA